MKKIFSTLFVALTVSVTATAQTVLATLSHDGSISMFYGTDALVKAHEAAEAGDIITLSPGTFNSPTITKALTIRGAGMEADSVNQRTILNGNVYVAYTDSIHDLTLEGVYCGHTLLFETETNDVTLLKCRFYQIQSNYVRTNGLQVIHCRIPNSLAVTGPRCDGSYNGAVITNSILGRPDENWGGTSSNRCSFSITNSIMFFPTTGNSTCDYRNCILVGSSVTYVTANSTYNHNLFISDAATDDGTNVVIKCDDSRANNFVGVYSEMNDYKLNDELRALIKGSDGTEVGIYGGSIPFSPTPTNPQITKFNVADKTDANGKLSVDISVKVAQ